MKEKVKITGVPETMIQTLYARAKETQKNNAKIKDDIAVGIEYARIDGGCAESHECKEQIGSA